MLNKKSLLTQTLIDIHYKDTLTQLGGMLVNVARFNLRF